MSKWPDNAVCQTAAERLAAWLAEEAGTLRAMTAQEVASTLNALSKWPDSTLAGRPWNVWPTAWPRRAACARR